MTEIEKLEQGVAALEAQRTVLGDAVVEAMLAPVREKLAALQAATAVPVTQQRKHVTVLFADISGFTALADMLDAEDVATAINTLWQQVDGIIATHGGKVDKHIGDAVMALWGTETAREDDPEQALKAALAMQTAVQAWQLGSAVASTKPAPILLALRIGVNTGPVLLGVVGSTGEFTAMGDTVNVAARLEHAAPVGGILIAHDTYRQVRGVFDVAPQPPLNVKGKAEPLQVYLVERLKPRAFRMLSRGVEGLETHLVGRAAEMHQLQTAFDTVVQQQRLQVVTVVGDAGLGKSRLVQEFMHWAELAGVTSYLFRGRAAPSLGEAPYALLRDILAFRFEIHESDALDTARARLEAGMAALCPQDPHIQEKAHFLGHLVGWDFSASPYLGGLLDDAPQIRALALQALALFWQNLGTHYPILLLLEDLHWADHSSLEALQQVLGNLPPATPLLVVANVRPTLFEQYPAWLQTTHVRVELRPLSEADSAALVMDILRQVPDLPIMLRDAVVHQADGNPFYMEELIKMLIDEKVIQPGATAWHVTPDRLATLRVPPTLTGVLQARLDSLSPVARQTLQRAAVVGRTFWDTAIYALGAGAPSLPEVQTALSAAAQREMLFQRAHSAFADASEYWFKHILLRDVVYDTVLKRERGTYHARAAAWLEALSGARRREYLPQIAEHYEKAGNTTRAAQCWEQAGLQAMQVSAFADAIRFFTHALPLTPASQTAALALQLAEAHFRSGNFAAAHTALEKAQANATTDATRATVLALLGEVTMSLGNDAEALQLLTQAQPLARASGDPRALCRALSGLGKVYEVQNELTAAWPPLQESLELARAQGDVSRELFALNELAVVAFKQKDLLSAEQLANLAHTRALAVGNRMGAMTALNILAAMAYERQDTFATRDCLQEALALAREIGAQQNVVLYLSNLAGANIKLGQGAAAREHLREALALALRLGALPYVMATVVNFAELMGTEGQPTQALALFGLARQQPAWNAVFERGLDMLVHEWALDATVVAAGLAQGAELDWETTLQGLMQA